MMQGDAPTYSGCSFSGAEIMSPLIRDGYKAGIPLQGSQPPHPPCPKENLEPLEAPGGGRL